jgi:GT2 family glycosyltransferase/transcription elongation factor Elf1
MNEIDPSLPEPGLTSDIYGPDDLSVRQYQLELGLLKDDYKKLLVQLYEKNELLKASTGAIGELRSSMTGIVQSLSSLVDTKNELADQANKQAEEIADKTNIISEQNRKVQELYGQVDRLNVQLSEIYASEGWKLLSVFYGIRNSILPVGSSRQQKVKKIVNRLRGKKSDNIVIKDHSRSEAAATSGLDTPTHFEPFEFPYFSDPKVSIIIPAYNGWAMNYQCLRSIRENTQGISYEVIFADDVSTDETAHVGDYIGNIVHIRNEKNLGFLQNCNHAASFARGEYLHFLNNDTKVTPDWLNTLVELMERDPMIGMAGSKLVYPDGRLQEAGGIIWQDASGWNYGHKQDPDAPEFNYVKEVDYISGASIMVRKSIWEQLGGFNEMYNPAYCEDSDLAFSIRQQGLKVVYQPLSKVIHFEGFSHGTDNAPQSGLTDIKSYQKINAAKFAEKWQPVLQQQFPNGVNPYWTRDRSHGKPTIVVIDHYVPHFDKDAGSRTTFQYLELFTELGMNVKFIGDNFYKHEPYTTILQQMGIEVLYGTYYAENWMNWLKDNDPYIDFILLNRPHISIKYMDLLKSNLRAKLFYYMHDLHFHRELMEYAVSKDPEKLKSSAQWKEIEYELFTRADVVLTPSQKEKEIIQPDFPDKPVAVMPAFFYSTIAEPIRNFAERNDILFVGGFGHKPNTDAVLWFAREIIPLIREKTKEIRLIVVGSNVPQEIASLASSDIIIKGFVTDEELNRLYDSVRLAVIPLRFGGGLKGKTAEALSKALPIVSTSFGVEGMENSQVIAPAYDTAPAFAEAVITLYNDTGRLEDLSVSIAEFARRNFTKDAAAGFFKKLFSSDMISLPSFLKNEPVPDMSGKEVINCLFCNSSKAVSRSKRADIVTCSSCGVSYLRTRPTQEAMYEIYQRYAHETSHMRPPDTIREAKQAGLRRQYLVDEILSLAGGPAGKGAWLDVGCGWGALLDEARDRGFQPKGIEITRNNLDFATMQLGIPVSNSQFLDSRIDLSSCAILTMVHVLEHLPYPKPTLEKIYEVLEEGGMFCGIVPNIESLCSEYLKDDWVWLDPTHHYVHYSPKTLKDALKKAGFVVTRLYTEVGDYDHSAVIDCIQKNIAGADTPEKAKAMIPQLMADGKGEEIRFFATKKKL